MSDVKYDTNADEFGRPPEQKQGSDITSKIIAWGFASNRQQAQYILIGLAIVIVIIAILVYRSA